MLALFRLLHIPLSRSPTSNSSLFPEVIYSLPNQSDCAFSPTARCYFSVELMQFSSTLLVGSSHPSSSHVITPHPPPGSRLHKMTNPLK